MGPNQGILLDILEKIISSHATNVESVSSLKSYTENINRNLSDMKKQIADIQAHFTNGFRSEVKAQIEEAMIETKDKINHSINKINDMDQKIDSLRTDVNSYKKFGFWLKLFSVIIAGIATISGAILGVLKWLT